MSHSSPSTKHRWTEEHRLTLALLVKLYENKETELFDIWNDIYSDVLHNEGFVDRALPARRFVAQIHDWKSDSWRSKCWNLIMSTPMQQVRKQHHEQKNTIEETAFKLGIGLRLRSSEPSSESPTKTTSQNDVSTGSVSQNDWRRSNSPLVTSSNVFLNVTFNSSSSSPSSLRSLPPESSINTYRLSTTPASMAVHRVESLASDTLSDTEILSTIPYDLRLHQFEDYAGNLDRRRPTLLFRACKSQHKFRARRFLFTTEQIPNPPRFQSPAFKDEVYPHLIPDKTYQSPFISLTSNPRVCLKLIQKRTSEGLSLAVFRYKDIEEEIVEQFDKHDRIYLVPNICAKHKINDLSRGYSGRDEWLVWGSIDAKPIGQFDTKSALRLLKTMNNLSKVSTDAGLRLGQRLKEINRPDRRIVARSLLCAFKIPGYDKIDPHSLKFEHFGRAVSIAARDGVRTEPSKTAMSTKDAQQRLDVVERPQSSSPRELQEASQPSNSMVQEGLEPVDLAQEEDNKAMDQAREEDSEVIGNSMDLIDTSNPQEDPNDSTPEVRLENRAEAEVRAELEINLLEVSPTLSPLTHPQADEAMDIIDQSPSTQSTQSEVIDLSDDDIDVDLVVLTYRSVRQNKRAITIRSQSPSL